NEIDYASSWNGTSWFGAQGTYYEITLGGQALAHTPAQLVLAWRGVGNNNNDHLCIDRGSGTYMGGRVTLGETTTERPALAMRGSQVILAWQGVGNNQL